MFLVYIYAVKLAVDIAKKIFLAVMVAVVVSWLAYNFDAFFGAFR